MPVMVVSVCKQVGRRVGVLSEWARGLDRLLKYLLSGGTED